MSDQDLLHTPMYSSHVALGGKLVPFAGYELPVRYSDIRQEHEAVRSNAGIFDVSHMGEIFVLGPDAEQYLQYLTCNDVTKLVDGRAQYSAFLNESAGVIDDIIVYRLAPERYLICVNAANTATDWEWCQQHTGSFNVTIENRSRDYGQIAIQGPAAAKIIALVAGLPAMSEALAYFSVLEGESEYGAVIVARTGYTGEDGFEIFVPGEYALRLWQDLLEVGAPLGLLPCGLGARDSLRLEACYPLHGHELSADVPALESGLSWIIKTDSGNFIGRAAVLSQKEAGVPRKLIGFFVEDKGVVREGSILTTADGGVVGEVTSGTLTPTIGRSLGLARVAIDSATPGNQLLAEVRGRRLAVVIARIPFYKRT